jgi:hypothetical protein
MLLGQMGPLLRTVVNSNGVRAKLYCLRRIRIGKGVERPKRDEGRVGGYENGIVDA